MECVGRIVPQSPNWGLVVDPPSVDFVLFFCFLSIFSHELTRHVTREPSDAREAAPGRAGVQGAESLGMNYTLPEIRL